MGGMGMGGRKRTKERRKRRKLGKEEGGVEREVTNPLSKSWIRPWDPTGELTTLPQTP